MPLPESGDAENPAFVPFTKTERIQQLNALDKDITQLLQSAGQTLKALSPSQSPPTTIAERKVDFQAACEAYLKTLQSIDVGLSRQIYGLEESGIISPEKGKSKNNTEESGDIQSKFAMGGKAKTAPAVTTDTNLGENGMGKLDIGWLNSRSGRVGRDMEAELWERARSFLEGLEKGESNGNGHTMDDEMVP